MDRTVILEQLSERFGLQDVNKIEMIYFWSLSCKHCKQIFNQLHNQHSDSIITIHVPLCEDDRDIDKVNQFINDQAIKLPVYFDHDHDFFAPFDSIYLPTLVVLEKEQDGISKMIYIDEIEEKLKTKLAS
ncbi:TlpA disulfide reductase family protein [Amphibacillus cookii]|uniref:TlpA disulfide reductase family protein n=1 Tax=Amphibacillus cookii TaxID=767787 RepID=UPI00195A5DD5|nr:TlpA disulfide reductase family protein [Amphibacillus cookii]MBM7541070.1 thiol-disulfide isomerase/thioredoxin [Amphibacillus cookii]